MFRDVCLLIRNWLLADRIRFTPGHCRLLQLVVSDRVMVRERLWIVKERHEHLETDGSRVSYRLQEFSESNVSELDVNFNNADPAVQSVTWNESTRKEELFDGDVVPLPKR